MKVFNDMIIFHRLNFDGSMMITIGLAYYLIETRNPFLLKGMKVPKTWNDTGYV